MNEPLLTVEHLSKTYRRHGARITALDDVGLVVHRGETLGLVGPSGSGKSTLARVVMRLIAPDQGLIIFAGEDLLALGGARLRATRARLQMVFQDPAEAFNPRATVARVIEDPLRIHHVVAPAARGRAVAELLDRVGLPRALASRHVHDLSGGQRQRVAIARAIATKPSLVVLDEAVSALDVSVRAQILNLLLALQRDEGLSYLFVSHDLGVIRAVSHRVAIMDRGSIVETGPVAEVTSAPRSRVGAALVAATPRLDQNSTEEIADDRRP